MRQDDELAHAQDALRSESLVFSVEHVAEECTCEGKWCPGCQSTKCHSDFSRDTNKKDGLRTYCRSCSSKRLVTWRQNNRERHQNREIVDQHIYGNNPSIEHVLNQCTCPGNQCPSCNQIKCYGSFNRDGNTKSGLQTYCRECQNARERTWRAENPKWREKYRGKYSEQKRAYYKSHTAQIRARGKAYKKANREKLTKTARRHRENNRERYRAIVRASRERHPETARAYYEKNRDKYREWLRTYRRNYPARYIAYSLNRRVREIQAGGSFTAQEWESLKAYYGYTCLCCRRQEPEIFLTADHVVPLARDGSGDISNIQPLCRSCNSHKGIKVIDYRKQFRRDVL